MESLILVANFSGNIRRETSGGRKFIVAPLTMIVPGVLNGSQGPLYYPEDEVVASTPYWEGVILTDDHLPAGANGKRISVQQQYALGYVQNPVIKNNRLVAEGWFDVERTRKINPKILTALEQGYKIELSTGLNVDFDNTSGVHNGRQYSQVVRKYRPDHLAVLIGKRGACSLNDGCGINNEEDNMLDQDELDTEDFDLEIEQDDVDNEWSEQARLAAAEARRAHSSGKSAARLKKISIQGAHVALKSKGYSLAMAPQSLADLKAGHTMYHVTDPQGNTSKMHAGQIQDLVAGFRSGKKVANEEDQDDDVDNAWSQASRTAAALARRQRAKAKAGEAKPFSDSDYEGFAGAEPWDNGDRPLMREVGKHLVVADKYGAETYDEGGNYAQHNIQFPSQEHAKAWMNGLTKSSVAKIHQSMVNNQEDTEVNNTWSAEARKAAILARKAHSASTLTGTNSQLSSTHQEALSHAQEARTSMDRGNLTEAIYHHMKSSELHYNLATHPSMPKDETEGHKYASDLHDQAAKKQMEIRRNVKNEEDDNVDNAWSDAARKAAALKKQWHKGGKLKDHQEGDKVRINPAYSKHGSIGTIVESAPSGHFHVVKHKDGSTSSYHESDLASVIYKSKVKNATTLPTDLSGKVIKKTKKKVMTSDCSYKSVTNETKNKENKMALTDAQKNELIDNVINNCACYTEDDRVELSDLDDRMLSSIANGIEAEKKQTVNNSEAIKTIDIKSLPVEVQRVLNYGAQAIQRDKEVLIEKLVANQATDDAKKARKEVLSKLTLEELQDRVSDLPPVAVDNSTFDFNRLVGNYSGAAAGGYKVANESGPAGGQLGSPEINWSKN